ncbi:LOW QUALITY PROTEIN: palmitoleoyl-protein carboxylesterase NOTUM [Drosophila subobscura]|uniref:LOW QUALITY PROTEIN: palmitoleoyl-protein carboxylesterase NOTUM n=1 Tax=Drosophila subobscura TaxID=7241 RepID=UPI00155A316D|nr:LOW QUALITY PROTEIN: palmitoleoyl-protein carboxylesterase NOTUM [Drosophila subobscura]
MAAEQIAKMAKVAQPNSPKAANKWIKPEQNRTQPQQKTATTPHLSLLLLLLLVALCPLPDANANASSSSSSGSLETFAVAAASTSLDKDHEQAVRQRARPAMETSMNMIQRNYMVMHPASSGSGSGSHSTTDHSRSLKRAALTNSSITCNDGTHAGFYLRKQPSSKKWIVFLEGGWHCFDVRSCRARWLRLRHLMTSSQWPETRDVGGILSPHAEENPYWHNANHVLIPYCSSDSWSGTRTEPDTSDRENRWRFMGALILRQVIADLIPLGLGRVPGGELLLVGSSAGGLGVMLNLDRIRDFLVNERQLQVTVRGVSDSGWFLDREPYTPAAVASSESVRQGWKLWQGLLPEDCTKAHPTEPWRCYFGYRLYPTLKTPLFVFQWLFDEAQMRADNVGAPVTPQQWNYIHEMGGALRSSLDNVSAVFAPSCIGHAVLSKRDWVNIKIDDISLPSALRCWEHSTRRKRNEKLKRSTEASTAVGQHPHPNNQRHQRHRQRQQRQKQKQNNVAQSTEQQPRKHNHLSKEQREERKRLRQEQRQRRKQRRRQQHKQQAEGRAKNNNNNNKPKSNASDTHKQRRRQPPLTPEERQEQRQRRRKAQQQQQQQQQQMQMQHEQPAAGGVEGADALGEPQKRRSSNNASASKPKKRPRVPRVPEKCGLRLLERCSWPQCNHSCPTLTNPLTGEEMRFLELLTSFGLDIEAVAAALGVDMHTLNNMERTELVNLLTQQVS